MHNAIYFTLFKLVGILKENEQDQTSKIVGFLSGSFFVGKLISDPIWGYVRDQMGDKKSLSLITIILFITLILFGLSNSLITMCIYIMLVGFASGVYVPGTAFMNWIEPLKRDYLAMWVYILSGAGALIGPFVGSIFITYMPTPKVLFTYGSIGLFMLIMTVWFIYAFKDFDDMHLIEASEYSKMEDDLLEIQAIEMYPDNSPRETSKNRLSHQNSELAFKNNDDKDEQLHKSLSHKD